MYFCLGQCYWYDRLKWHRHGSHTDFVTFIVWFVLVLYNIQLLTLCYILKYCINDFVFHFYVYLPIFTETVCYLLTEGKTMSTVHFPWHIHSWVFSAGSYVCFTRYDCSFAGYVSKYFKIFCILMTFSLFTGNILRRFNFYGGNCVLYNIYTTVALQKVINRAWNLTVPFRCTRQFPLANQITRQRANDTNHANTCTNIPAVTKQCMKTRMPQTCRGKWRKCKNACMYILTRYNKRLKH